MCRLAAFHSNDVSRGDIIDLLLDIQGKNTDGIGTVHLENGRFVINKAPISLEQVLKKKNTAKHFLSHLNSKFNGWTVIHMRGASPGLSVCKSNTHPWNVGNFAVCHNGFWREHEMPRLILKKFVKFYGSTDSETAAHMINILGPKKFSEEMSWGNGVFLALNRDGHLWAIKTSGDLVVSPLKNDKLFLISALKHNTDYKEAEAERGWYHFDEKGKYVKHKTKSWLSSNNSHNHAFSHIHTGASEKSSFNPLIQDGNSMVRPMESLRHLRMRSEMADHSEYGTEYAS